MASASNSNQPLPTGGPTAGGDELDDLFDYDGGLDDPFSENYVVPGQKKDTTDKAPKNTGSKEKGGAGLGIDEEIEVTRKPRAPRVKLDEHKLLSAAGIPKLRKRAKDHLKFKGKGHEYSDAARLLAFYQLWLDDLFPKARFLDALAMVEKMGHKRVLQNARMEWIDEGKPQNSTAHEDGLFDEPQVPPREDGGEREASRIAPIFEKAKESRAKTPANGGGNGMDDDDLYDATPRAARTQATTGGAASIFGPGASTAMDDGPPEDDLDALLAEGSMQVDKPSGVRQGEEFDDDLDALMAEREMDEVPDATKKPVKPIKPVSEEEDDYLDRLLAEEKDMLANRPPKAPAVEQDFNFDDDMEAMAGMDGF